MRYGAPRGLRSLVDDLAQGLAMERERVVEHVGPGPVVDGERYEAVVLAMPDPQALRLLGPYEPVAGLVRDRLWEPAYALAAGYAQRSWDVDGVFVDDPVLTWVADDGSRRGDGAAVLVAHSTGPFARQHLADPQAAAAPLSLALQGLLGLPSPEWTHVQRWTYSRPSGPRDEPYGLVDGVGLCGDGWGASKVQAAWLSGTLLGEALAS